jgi:hypothetical protein
MNALLAVAMVTGFYPLAVALSANRLTTLRTALTWGAGSLAAWVVAALFPESSLAGYLALCLTGCAGVAVPGARRPGAGAWNFVVAGLLAVLLLPVASGLGTPRLEAAHLVFLSGTLAVVVLNYLPGRLGPAAALAGVGVALEISRLAGNTMFAGQLSAARLLLVAALWLAWLLQRQSRATNEFDGIWLAFRDRYGFVWGERVREQFNRSAVNAGSSARLGWSGLKAGPTDNQEAIQILRALLKRFSTAAENAESANNTSPAK